MAKWVAPLKDSALLALLALESLASYQAEGLVSPGDKLHAECVDRCVSMLDSSQP